MSKNYTQKDSMSKSIKIKGYVYHIDKSAIGWINVCVLEKGLRRSAKIISTSTDGKGYYEVVIHPKQFVLNSKKPNIQLEVRNDEGLILAASETIFDLVDVNEINFVIDNENYKDIPLFDKISRSVDPHMEDIRFSELYEDEDSVDVHYLKNQAGMSLQEVKVYVKAKRLFEETGIDAEVFYVLFKQNIAADLDVILSQNSATIAQAIDKAVALNLVNADVVKNKEQIMKKISAAAINKVLTQKPQNADASIIDVVNIVTDDKEIHRKLFDSYNLFEGKIEDYWKKVKDELGTENKLLVEKVQYAFQLAAITGNQPAMVDSLIKKAEAAKAYGTVAAFAKWDESDWEKHIQEISLNTHKLCVPQVIEGVNDSQRIKSYAKKLTGILERAFPTIAFCGRLEKDNSKNILFDTKKDLQRFFNNNPQFDFLKHSTANLEDEKSRFKFNGIKNRSKTIKELQSIQRIFKFTPKYQAVLELKKDNLDAAYRIIQIPESEFAERYAIKIGSKDDARASYQMAQKAYMNTLEVYMQLNPNIHTGMHVTPSPIDLDIADPTLRTMFGSLEQCDCEECRTVYSPSAYYVDILNFLQKRAPVDVFKELKRRRPDLLNIELTCKNTNTPMPYVDLVLERLELLVMKHANPAVSLSVSYQTNGTAQELAANPEHLNTAAYDEVKKAVYPPALPFNFPLEEARIYLQYLGTNRADLIKALLPVNASADKNAPSPYNWATEYLGISPIEVDIITANSENLISNGINAQVCEYYGFNNTSGYNPIQDPADSQKSISGISWTSALSGRVDVFLQQTGLQYTELLYMLNTRFINPEINNSGDRRITIQSTDAHNPATCVLKSLSISGLNNRDFAKIYRFIRLWRKLGISSYDLDRLMMGLSLQLSSDEDIIKIANVMFISSKLALEIGEVLPFWCDIETFIYKDYSKTGQPDIIPLYDKLFRNKAVVNPVDNIFTTIREGGSASFSGHTAAILAALQITDDEFTLLVNELAININGANLNKASLSNLYRNVKLAKALSLTIKDYLTLKAMIGINPFAGINDTVRFLENIDNVKSSGFSIDLLSYLLCHQYTEETSIAPTTQAIAVFLTELRTELKKVILKVTSEMSSAERTAAETAYAESRYDIIKQKIAEKLKITPAAAKTLLVDVLKGRYNPAKAVIEDFVVSSYLCNDLQLVKENAEAGKSIELPRLFENFILLDKIATFINKLKIADEELPYILTKSTQLGIANLSLLPIAAVSTAQFEQFNGLINLIKARDLLPFGTLAFFDIHKYTFNTELSNQTAKGNWIDGIKKRTNWDEALITSLVGTKTQISQGGILRVNFPADFKSGKLLLRLNECVDLIKRIGLSPSKLSNLVKRDLDADNSKEAKNAAKARHAEKEWYEIAKPLREQLRDKQRAALAAYLLARPSHNMHQYWRTTEELYEYLLIDVEMCPDMYTSRIKQAISSVQLYVDRVLMNLEHYNMDKTSDALKLSIDQVKEWREWRKLYRIWEANRKVFLYPENWIEPELRDDKSPFFKELESQLMQNEVTLENVEDAFLGYLEKLDAVSRLEIRGIYHQEEPENNIDIIHVIGRTHGMPHKYFYRKLVSGEWTAWEKIDLDIEGEHLIPIVWNRRLHLFWLVCVDKAQEGQIKMPNAGDSLTGANKYIEIKLAWSEYKKNKWTAKRVSKNFISSEAGIAASNSTGLDSDKITNWNDSLRNRYYLSCKPSSDKLNIIISKQESSLKHNPLYTFIFRNSNTEPEAYDSLKVNNYKVVPPPACYAEAGIFKGKISLCYDKYKVGASRVDPDSSPAAIQYQTIIDQYDKLLGAVEGGFSLALMPDKLLRPYSDSFFMQDSKSTFFVGRSTERVEDEFLGHRDMVDLSRLADILNHYYYEEIAYPFPEPDPVEFGDGITDPPMENIFDPINEEAILFNNIIDNPDTFVVINGQTIRGNEFTSNGLYIETYGESYPNNCAASYSGLMTKSMVLPSKTDMVYRSYTTNVSYNKDKMRGFKNNGVRHYHYEERFTFYTYYQPNVKALINELNKDGLDGMLNRSMQMVSDTMNFNQKYKPHEEIVRHISPYSYPDNCMDFSYGGAYSQYNWELFFHVPLMIALRLSQNQRFDEARKWFHYVFDPTNSEGGGKERFWQFKPFYDEAGKTPQTLEQLMKSINDNVQQVVEQVDKWMQNPFKPHVIARMRILAYMKNVVMKYIDNLISWADQLFRRDTIESINEATQLYVLASKILGERPQKVPPRAIPVVQTYEELDDKLDAFSNAMVNIELFIQPSTAGHISTGSSGNVLKMAYFGIAKNAKLLEYWDLVADRLFKIRHCMNIDGIVRQLPLFEPPIDPAMLVRAAASGMDLSSIISGSDVSLPNYRFSIMLQKANDLCNDVKSLGSVLLIALEKKDAEELALLRQSHEIRLLNAVRDVKKKQVDEAAENIESLKKGKIITQLKYAYYASRPFTNAYEAEHLYSLQAGIVLQLLQGGTEMIASALSAVPDIKIGAPTSLGATFGGSNIGMVMKAFSSYLGIMCEINKISGTLSSTLGSYHRRADDWKFQADCARKELDQVDNQIAAAEIRLAIAEKELQNHDVQMQNAQEVDEYMHNKYTNKELYEWMVEQLSTVYFQSYQLAFDMAKKAEKCLHYEIAADNMQYIQFGYWYSLKKGLLTGEKLQYDLRRMETAYMEKNKRHFELTKHISLAVFKPEAIIALKRDGFCSISLPEELFDLDYPGHYLRRIKSVSFTIPCIVGPYTTVNCTLRLKAHKTRLTPIGSNFETITSMSRTQAIATSSAQNDSGMFELNFRDERYLPFEGCGAISNWDIELSTDAVLRQFDYETISDVILNIRYTALEDGALKIQACENLKKVINNTIEGTNPMPLTRMFSLKHEFPAQWHKFLNNDVEGEEKVLELSITKDMFPYLSKGKNIKINGMYIYAKCKGTNPYVAWVSPPLTENNGDAIPLTLVSGMHQGSLDVSAKSVNLVTSQDNVWKLKMKKGTVDSSNPIESQDVEEIILVLKYNL